MFDKHDQELLDNLIQRLLELESELKQEMDTLSCAAASGQSSPHPRQRLERVERALDKLRVGEGYGSCERCEAPLSREQLCTDPDCLLCHHCKALEHPY